MPSREEQFDDWYASATRDDLLASVTDKKRSSLEDEFVESKAFTTAQEEFVIDELENGGSMEDFNEAAWYDESAEADDEEDDADLGEGD